MPNRPEPSHEELRELCEKLQARVTRFSVVEQSLITAKDRIDKELARFQSIQAYSKKAIHITDLHDFGTITSESVIVTFEFECSALYLYDHKSKLIKVLGSSGFTDMAAEYPVKMEFIESFARSSDHVVTIEKPRPSRLFWNEPDLCQIIYCPFHDITGNFRGILLGGRSETNQAFYDEINKELISSFAVFSNQMEALFHNIESHQKEKELESRIQRGMKMEAIGTLAGGIAHDFNNILAAIMGYSEMAKIDLEPEHRAYNNVEEIIKATQRAKKLILQVLTFGKPGIVERKIIKIDLVVRESLGFLKASLPATIDFVELFEPNLYTIEADPTQIHQLVMNLCTNSAHAMEPAGGTLQLSLENIAPGAAEIANFIELGNVAHVKLTVKDSGTGIDPDIIDKVFDPYFTTKKQGKGTGIGLAQVHGIVKMNKGAISISSEPGVSTIIKVYFPAKQTEAVIEDDCPDISIKGKGHILFVDDEEMIIDVGKKILQYLGYNVSTCINPITALDLFSRHPGSFDLVITDMTMPQMNGDAFAEKLREIRPEIPIIVCTGHSSLMDESKARQLGIDAFLMKPVLVKNMSQAIQQVFDKSTNCPSCRQHP